MDASFLFYSDPGLTTPIRGSVMLTVDAAGNGADVTLYFGSPYPGRYCLPDGTQTIIVSIEGVDRDVVDLALSSGGFVGAREVELGNRVNGGVGNRIPLFFRADSVQASLSVACSPLVEYVP